MPVYFYDTKENPYGCFTNFSRHGFELDGDWWRTSEHYFQAQKFAGTPHAEEIRKLPTPREAFDLAHKLKHLVRADWSHIRDDVMRKAVQRKFEFNGDIQAVLLSTGDALLVEDSPTDSYWGCGADRKGKNMLGQILMEVREKFRTLPTSTIVNRDRTHNKPDVHKSLQQRVRERIEKREPLDFGSAEP
ncbi:NADAR family protein [Microcoleus sp. FACHB-SPT15]|uniref:NADAR family protein n=1 Tax=Microcoleus sp. FACHB-SPT15 TaxID=2692830 RepID=UPI0017850D1B|nr:NADAR family protein [Microcoleus sp. FACHB-SPT15]MBD1809569.1 NADAR family protein [Microcoleus sp. FACHB-SPT15]